ncbi:MAG TPA: SH3 domain-containing protein [Chloroflexota bacterium]
MRYRIANTDGQGANVRPEPNTTAPPIFSVPEGGEVDGDEHAWRQVTDAAGEQGWIANEFLRHDGDHFVVANTEGLGANLRHEPSTSAERVKPIAEGTALAGAEHAWRRVSASTGRQGWIAEDLLVGVDPDLWSFDIGLACSRENYWDPNGQPKRRTAMERFNQLPYDRRKVIFEQSMDAGLDAEGIVDPDLRERWKLAMRTITLGEGFPGECPDLNPFMLAGEVGGVFRGGADNLNSSALGYFQFIAQKPIPVGNMFTPDFDYGHWKRFGPCPDDYAHQTEPVCQVREFIRAILGSTKHHGDPMSVVEEKRRAPHVWGP